MQFSVMFKHNNNNHKRENKFLEGEDVELCSKKSSRKFWCPDSAVASYLENGSNCFMVKIAIGFAPKC